VKRYLIFLVAFGLFDGFLACQYDPIQPDAAPIPKDSCSWDQISYQKIIAPIVASNCVASVCHNNGSAPRGIGLDGHYQLSYFVKSDSARFLGVIRQVGFYTYMPLGRPKLDSCTISKLEAWIRQGAQNN
jgi:hypothetical protein